VLILSNKISAVLV